MKASAIFFVFFLLFTAASIAVPVPMFPGNMISGLLGIQASEYLILLEGLTNGATYAFITWLVFVLLVRRIEHAMSMESEKTTH